MGRGFVQGSTAKLMNTLHLLSAIRLPRNQVVQTIARHVSEITVFFEPATVYRSQYVRPTSYGQIKFAAHMTIHFAPRRIDTVKSSHKLCDATAQQLGNLLPTVIRPVIVAFCRQQDTGA